jgi:hypothetical protein
MASHTVGIININAGPASSRGHCLTRHNDLTLHYTVTRWRYTLGNLLLLTCRQRRTFVTAATAPQ